MSLPRPNWSDTVAVFGGTFDPPHRGHREAVRGLFADPGVKQVLILPSPAPPHKPAFAPVEDRIRLTELNFGPEAGADLFEFPVRMDLRELERARRHPDRPSYTFDTLTELQQELPSAAFVVGADQLEKLHTWHRFPEILGLAHWIVLERLPNGHEVAEKALSDWAASGLVERLPSRGARDWVLTPQTSSSRGPKFLSLAATQAPRVSSTEIREAISRAGKPPENSLLPEVAAYLKQRGLYGITSSSESI